MKKKRLIKIVIAFLLIGIIIIFLSRIMGEITVNRMRSYLHSYDAYAPVVYILTIGIASNLFCSDVGSDHKRWIDVRRDERFSLLIYRSQFISDFRLLFL